MVAPQITPQPGFTTSPTAPTTTTRAPRPLPPPTATSPTETTPGPTETVTYEVTGEGRAINITYLDTGNMLQTEFNVPLPWSKSRSNSPHRADGNRQRERRELRP